MNFIFGFFFFSDGSGCIGIFCVINIVLEWVKFDGLVDMF